MHLWAVVSYLWAVVSYLWAQFWALVSYLRFLNVELYIELLRRRRIIYAIRDVINLQNVGSWNWDKVFPYGSIDAKSF